MDPVLTHPILDLRQRRRRGLGNIVDRDDHIAAVIGKGDDFRVIVDRHGEARLQYRLKFCRELVGGIGARCAAGVDRRGGNDRQLGRGNRVGEARAIVDLILDLGHQVGQSFLALGSRQLGSNLIVRLGKALAAGAANVVNLDDVPAQVGADGSDDAPFGGTECGIGHRRAGQ